MIVPIWPLHQAIGVERIAAATYQAASGAGARAMYELIEETRKYLDGEPFERTVIPHQYAFNLFPHNSPFGDNGYCEEEWKMVRETRKIFHEPDLPVTATCVRVPVLRAHAEAVNITFKRETSEEEIYTILAAAAGVTVAEDRERNTWPMPITASGADDILVGRVRRDLSAPRTFDLWIVGDQLLKGAALNAVQIAELLV
jgi:aspartate-semialdehyde dehydrogenase